MAGNRLYHSRNSQNRRSKNDRHHAAGKQFQRQHAVFLRKRCPGDLRHIRHLIYPLAPQHEIHEHEQHKENDGKNSYTDSLICNPNRLTNQPKLAGKGADDSCQQKQRDAVSEKLIIDQLPHPGHQQRCRDHQRPGNNSSIPGTHGQQTGPPIAIHHSRCRQYGKNTAQYNSQPLDLLSSHGPVPLHRSDRRDNNAEQLHENRRCNIRRYAQRRNRHTTQIAACQNIQQTHGPTGTHQDLNHRRIHERQGHTGQQPVYQQAQQCASHLLRQCQPLRYLDITHTKKLPSYSGILSAHGQKTLIYEHIIS